ncbi:hypothetical protein RAS2_23420 [Phycisphaerae bacterium RAS2]|nr:hypothetical protein RAS2_23420 [Phycisphaerae bacterium RAS2]
MESESGWEAQQAAAAKRISAALQKGRGTGAVRILLQALERNELPSNGELWDRLRARLGASASKKLIAALASMPCFYCKSGVQRCEHCDGDGCHSDASPCGYCLGFGIASCDFCNGSGRATYTVVPSSLRMHVLEHRMQQALKEANQLLKAAIPTAAGRTIKIVRRDLAGRLFQIDRVMGVLENAVTSAREASRSRKELRKFAARVIRVARRVALKLDARMRQVLKQLVQVERSAVATTKSTAVKPPVLARIDLLHSIRKRRGFHGCTFQHPFLKLGSIRR